MSRSKRDLRGHGGDERLIGRVMRVDSRICLVEVNKDIVKCRVRGVLFRNEKVWSRPVAAGDQVEILKGKDKEGLIVEVLPRRNVLSRPQVEKRRRQLIASNLDQVLIVNSVTTPALNLRFIDRILVTCERNDFNAVLVLNKMDLLSDWSILDPIRELYGSLGYEIIETSVVDSVGIDAVRAILADKTTVLTGLSGVGKSSLLNVVEPGLSQAIQTVSDATGKGRHTTTRSEILPLSFGGHVVDTPGMREFGIEALEPFEIAHCFREFPEHASGCFFRTCSHTHESDCAVRAAVEQGEINAHRYESYLRIIES